MTDKLISIIIPTYNYAAFLPRALDSALAQVSDNIEVIVVDDGSTDHTDNILEAYASRYPVALRCVSQENSGPAAARNRGVLLSNGRYVLFLDADDELIPGALQKFCKAVESNAAAGMILGGHVSVSHDGCERKSIPKELAKNPRKLISDYLLAKRIRISPGSVLFRKDLLLQRLYPEQFRGSEDIPVFAFMLVSDAVTIIKAPLVRNYRHPDSLRNQWTDEDRMIEGLVEETFLKLPIDCLSLKSRYKAQRYLSLFRRSALQDDKSSAILLYKKAFSISPMQALRWNYLRKAVRLLLF